MDLLQARLEELSDDTEQLVSTELKKDPMKLWPQTWLHSAWTSDTLGWSRAFKSQTLTKLARWQHRSFIQHRCHVFQHFPITSTKIIPHIIYGFMSFRRSSSEICFPKDSFPDLKVGVVILHCYSMLHPPCLWPFGGNDKHTESIRP